MGTHSQAKAYLKILAAAVFFMSLLLQIAAFPIGLVEGFSPEHIPWLAILGRICRGILTPSDWIATAIYGDGYLLIHLASAWLIIAIVFSVPWLVLSLIISSSEERTGSY